MIVIISQSISTGKTYVKFVKYLNLIEARYFSIFILVESSIPPNFFGNSLTWYLLFDK